MELTLNLAWMALVTLMLWLWICRSPREDESRWTQFVALAVIVLILFPAISITDDLIAAQSLAENDSYQRKDHVCSNGLSTQRVVPGLFLPVVTLPYYSSSRVASPDHFPSFLAKSPAVASIQNRPPPVV
jgi:hypothetical protein